MNEEMLSGVLCFNKPKGCTSHDVIYRVRKLYGTRQVGHTGTLDPLAEGVLVMLVGRAAKAAEYLVSDRKAYVATLRLGVTTDTEDTTGTVLSTSNAIPDAKTVSDTVASFSGVIEQVPPMYSALKVDGKKLCDLARQGKTVERQARQITVYSISVSPTDTPTDYTLSVECSSGTYIRTLCADIGKKLGCGGVMATLLRTSAGGFSIEDAVTLEQLEQMSAEERLSHLIPTEKLFSSLPAVRLPEFYYRLCLNGCEIYQKKIKTDFPAPSRVRVCSPDGVFFALGEVREYENGTAIKAIKLF
jgi:tRNA pseudouridine55 synthase